jgi:crotonobetainyl-CoA:carnitine CoA-transferase CaiB-like acyl-CoA transferase
MKLIERADVMIWNNRPHSMARMKLAYADVRAVNPKIIYCGMFGFGQDGRYRDKPAYDTIIQGSAGMSAIHHRSFGEPRFVPMVVADKVVGLIAVQMIAMALYGRTRTGEGCSIEIPMFENFAKFVLEEHMYLKTFVPALGETGDPRLIEPLNKPVPTRDGWICISANTNAQVFAFFDAVGRPELKTDPRFSSVPARFTHVKEYFDIRMNSLKTKTTAEWLEIFDRSDVPAMPYHTLDSLLEDPHLADVGFFELKDHPTEDAGNADAEQVVDRRATRMEPRAEARPEQRRNPARAGLRRGRDRRDGRGGRYARRSPRQKVMILRRSADLS